MSKLKDMWNSLSKKGKIFTSALGIILLLISLSVNALVMALNLTSKRYAFA